MTPLQAELYSLTHRGSPGDRELYARVCSGARRVLELGCGYGRLLPVLASEEREVVGIELDARLRALARREAAAFGTRVRVVAGDMRRFTLGARFDRVLIPHSGVYCLLDRASLLASLRAARRHLSPRGRLVFDAYAADEFHAESSAADLDERALEPVVSIDVRGTTWDVFEQSRWHKRSQRLDVSYLYVPRTHARTQRIDIPQRYLLRAQIPRLLADAGLELVALRGAFGRKRARPEYWVVEARTR